VLSVAAVAGCGTSDDRDEVRGVARAFMEGFQAKDGAAACRQLGSETTAALEDQESESCAKAITGVQFDPAAITRIRVYVTNAIVDLATGDVMFLGREPGGWRVTALGCRPSGPPTEEPYDCEVED